MPDSNFDLNETQIRLWVSTNQPEPIISLISVLKNQRDRAELTTRAYLHEIKILTERTNKILKPLLEPKREKQPHNEQLFEPKLQPFDLSLIEIDL